MLSADCYRVMGQGCPVVMFHSSMSSKGQWKELAQALSSDYQVITLDLLGYGAAEFPKNVESFSLEDEGHHIDAILAQNGISEETLLHVIGHSYGGATALHWCWHRKSRIQSLHLFEPVAFQLLDKASDGYANVKAVVDRLDVLMSEGKQKEACQHFIDYWSGKGAYDSFPEHIQKAMVTQVPKVVLDFKALMGTTLGLADYAQLTMPKTLVKGMRSPISSRQIAGLLEERLQNMDVHEVDCGHMGPITHSKLVNEILIKAFQL